MRSHPMLAAVIVALVVFPAAAEERRLSRSQVPPPVLSAFETAYPKAKALRFAEEENDGKACYEIESREDGTRRDLLFSADGSLLEIEEVVPESALPAAVREEIARLAPKAKVQSVEKVTRGGKVTFEIALSGAGTRELVLDAGGKAAEIR